MQLNDLGLDRNLYKAPLDGQTWDADTIADNLEQVSLDATAVMTGGAAADVNNGSVTIDGTQLTPGTIPQTTLDIANWGWTQSCVFSIASATQVNWGSGIFNSADGTPYTIASGNTGTMSGSPTTKTYIYFDLASVSYLHTTVSGDSVGIGKVLVAIAQNGASAASFNTIQGNQITGDNILANTIDATKIVSGSITATQISSGYVYAGTISANNVTAGSIVGSTLSTATSGQRTVLTTTLASFYDGSNVHVVDTYASAGAYLISGIQSGTQIQISSGSAGQIYLSAGLTSYLVFDPTSMKPVSIGGNFDLGDGTFPFGDLYLNGDLHLGGSIVGQSLNQYSEQKDFTGSGTYTITTGFKPTKVELNGYIYESGTYILIGTTNGSAGLVSPVQGLCNCFTIQGNVGGTWNFGLGTYNNLGGNNTCYCYIIAWAPTYIVIVYNCPANYILGTNLIITG